MTEAFYNSHQDFCTELKKISQLELNGISERANAYLAGSKSPAGIYATVSLEELTSDLTEFLSRVLVEDGFLVYLDKIADPGNAGTIIRSADAFGAKGVLFSPESVDIFNDKVLRSTAGSIFNIPVFQIAKPNELFLKFKENNWEILTTELTAKVTLQQVAKKLAANHVWVFGNEAQGISTALSELATSKVKIEMSGKSESLNVAVAAAICLYQSVLQQ